MNHNITLLAVAVLVAAGTMAAAEEGPTRQDLLTMIQALKYRNELLEKRLAQLEARVAEAAGGGPNSAASRSGHSLRR
jgi:hypothetical protein